MNTGNLRNRLLFSMLLRHRRLRGLLHGLRRLQEVADSFGDFRWELLPLILLVTCGNYALRFVKWEYYLRLIGVVRAEARSTAS